MNTYAFHRHRSRVNDSSILDGIAAPQHATIASIAIDEIFPHISQLIK